MSEHTEVVVVGGGYSGVMAANRLTQREDVTVTVVNPRPCFVERIRLHQLVGGSDDAVVDYREILAPGIGLVLDTATAIDSARARGDAGQRPAGPLRLSDLRARQRQRRIERARRRRVRNAYRQPGAGRAASVGFGRHGQSAPVTVVGAGPSGIETAAELAEQGRRVTLVCGDQLGPYLHPRGRRSVAKHLKRLGVTILEGVDATVTAVTRDGVQLSDGSTVPSAVIIWTAGFGVPDLAVRSGLSTDAAGRLLTDETLTSVDDQRIVAAGDSAAPSDLPFRMSCQAAGPLGAHAADTVLLRIAGQTPAPIELGFAGQCISLGRKAGIFQFAHRNDVANRFFVGGRAGAKLKAIVCWGTVKQLADEARKPGSLSWGWSKDNKRQHLLQAKPEQGASL